MIFFRIYLIILIELDICHPAAVNAGEDVTESETRATPLERAPDSSPVEERISKIVDPKRFGTRTQGHVEWII